MKKLFIFTLITVILASSFGIFSASALDAEMNCPVYVYDSSTQSFFGYGYLYLEGDTTDSIFRLHGYNERDITLDFSAPNEAGTDYYLSELRFEAVNGPGLYGINFVDGPDANSMATLPVIPMYNVSYSDGIFWSDRYDWSTGYADGFAIVLYFNGFEPAEAYDPPYTPGEIQSGFDQIESDLSAIESGLTIDTIAVDDILDLQDFLKFDSEVNPFQPISEFLNVSFIVFMLCVVFSFGLVGYLLYGKRA